MKAWEAIEYVEQHGGTLHKYADPIDGARIVTVEEAREIAKQDCNLIYCKAAK
jgi:hypothetical protein